MKVRFPWRWKKKKTPAPPGTRSSRPGPGEILVENLGAGYVLETTEHFDKQEGSHVPGTETRH